MDGYETTRRIRAWESQGFTPKLLIVAVTANVQPGERERALQAGMDAYLSKPYSIEALASVLDHISDTANDTGAIYPSVA